MSTVVAELALSCGVVDPGSIILLLGTDSQKQRLTKRLKQKATSFSLDETEDVDLSSDIIQDTTHGINLLTVDSDLPGLPGLPGPGRIAVGNYY